MSDDGWNDDEGASDRWADEDLGADDWIDAPDDSFDAPDDSFDAVDPYDSRYAEAEDWIDARPPMSTAKRVLLALGVVAAVLVVAAAGAFLWVQHQIDPSGPPGSEIELEVASGSTTEDIGHLLEDNDVITSAMVWNYWTRLENKGPFEAGVFVFREHSSFQEAVAVLDAGPKPPELQRVTIPEGLTVTEIVTRLADPTTGVDRWDAGALQDAIDSPDIRSRYQPDDVTSMEGMLFPDTYEIDDKTDERAFIRRLVTQLDTDLDALDVETGAAALGVSPYQIVIIASLVEEEAKVPEDRAKIARVIYNRLEQGIPLGIDATSRYQAVLEGRSRDDVDFESDSPYNTRRVAGLPPTPIAAAGRASLEAALNPEPGAWIYYVLKDAEGHHAFLETAREFQKAKQECIRQNLGCG